MDFSEEHSANVSLPIRVSFEFDSNVTFSREVQQWKQDVTSISTEAGMQIDFSDEQQKMQHPLFGAD
jgi:hypothetical protein